MSDLLTKFAPVIDTGVTRTYDCPIEEGLVLSPDDSPTIGSPEYDEMAGRRDMYMAIVGALLWLANMTHPQLCYTTSQLSRFISNPGAKHFAAAVRALVYLRGCADRVLLFAPNTARDFETFVDSSWLTSFSCSGAFFFMYGCLFHWFAKTQRSISLSSAEAEYFGAMLAAKDVLFIRDLLIDLALAVAGPSVIYSDSKSAVDMAFDPVAFKKTKHILRAAEFLRDLVARGAITMAHVAGVVMIADLLTKAQARPVFLELLRLLDGYAANGVTCPAK